LQIWEATTAKRTKIQPYRQRLNCSPLNVLFSNVQITMMLLCVPPLWGLQSQYSGQKWRFSNSIRENILLTVSHTAPETADLL